MFVDAIAIEVNRLREIVYAVRLTGGAGRSPFNAGWVVDGFSIIRPGRIDPEHRRKLLTEGRCVTCGGTELETQTLCSACAEVGRARAARTADRRRLAGQCAGCGEPDTVPGSTCAVCREAGRRIRAARLAAGRCPCGVDSEPAREYCRRCHDRRAAQNRQRRARVKYSRGTRGGDPREAGPLTPTIQAAAAD